jgi:hypothetical protein
MSRYQPGSIALLRGCAAAIAVGVVLAVTSGVALGQVSILQIKSSLVLGDSRTKRLCRESFVTMM